jgi:protein-disulfide isomerase
MPRPWLAFLSIGTIGLIVFIFYILRLQPVKAPSFELENTDTVTTLTAPVVTFVNPAKGSATPKVTIVEYGDFECEPCKQNADAIDVVLRTYPDDIRVVWKDMPNESTHPVSTPAAIAAHCADRQGKFWEYHDALFAQQSVLDDSVFFPIALAIGLNTESFSSCYNARDTLPIVKRDFDEGLALGILATPTTYINDTPYVGALTADELIRYVEQAKNTNK